MLKIGDKVRIKINMVEKGKIEYDKFNGKTGVISSIYTKNHNFYCDKGRVLFSDTYNVSVELDSFKSESGCWKFELDELRHIDDVYFFDDFTYEEEVIIKFLMENQYEYMARDENGDLYAYVEIPVKIEPISKKDGEGFWQKNIYDTYDSLKINNNYFPNVKWEDYKPYNFAHYLG